MNCRNALQALTLISVWFVVAGCSKSIALPNALSCSTNDYPSAFDKGMLVFADLTHDGVKSLGIVALAPLTGHQFLGTSSVEKTDRVLTLQGVGKADGSTDVISGTMRLHLVSSEGADRYKLDLTMGDGKGPTHWQCLGPIAQKQYAQEVHAKQAKSPAPSVPQAEASPERQQAEPSQQQQMEWIVNKIAGNGGNCRAIAQNLQTYMRATGVYDSPMISKMLYTAQQIGCI
jgi:hypothetical protein